MDCMETQRFLHAYIDEEFDERERVEFEYHLSHCPDCRQQVAYYYSLRQKLQESSVREIAPIHLEAKIRCALREQVHHNIRPIVSGFSFTFAALFAFVVMGGVSLWPSLLHLRTESGASSKTQRASVGLTGGTPLWEKLRRPTKRTKQTTPSNQFVVPQQFRSSDPSFLWQNNARGPVRVSLTVRQGSQAPMTTKFTTRGGFGRQKSSSHGALFVPASFSQNPQGTRAFPLWPQRLKRSKSTKLWRQPSGFFGSDTTTSLSPACFGDNISAKTP